MGMNDENRVSRRAYLLLLTSLMIALLVSSIFVCVFVNSVGGVSLENAVYVKNETELKNAIKNASNDISTTIALDNDITLTEPLKISNKKDITLTSNSDNDGYYNLIGAARMHTITVEDNGVLRLDGIIVIHVKGASGIGVGVSSRGCLFLYSGEISGNTADLPEFVARGGGVDNSGTFEMHGGKISGNKAMYYGGSVDNGGTFLMYGGEISGNIAGYGGGGVFNVYGPFRMFGGKITGNTANGTGGGVFHLFGVFDRLGGVISGNTARYRDNDVYVDDGSDNGGGVVEDVRPSDNVQPSYGGDGGGVVDGGNEPSVGDGGLFFGVFSLRDVVFICVGVILVVVGVVVAVLFFTFKKELEFTRKKVDMEK